jgi:arylsulfatase A-like enzyme
VPVIRGDVSRVRETVLLAYRNVQRSVRDNRWKLIRYPQVDQTQLFDLNADPDEIRNLADAPEHQGTVQRMLRLLREEQERYGDQLPLTVPAPAPATFEIPNVQPRPADGGLAPDNVHPAKRT